MQSTRLGHSTLEVGELGLGTMGMSAFYTGAGVDDAESIRTIHEALDLGANLIDTAEVYGPYTNEELVGRALAGRRDDAVLATKFGIMEHIPEDRRGIDSRPENIRIAVEGSLARLNTDRIDLYYQHRPDPSVPVEEVVGVMRELIEEGKIVEYGLSEAGVDDIRRAHAEHPLAALQTEYSLWTRGVEGEILPTLRELGISLVPYSPLGRGFLTGQITSMDQLDAGDYRQSNPRFKAEAFEANMAIVREVEDIAGEVDATAAQVALAWLRLKGGAALDIVPIPGTRRVDRLRENVASTDVDLSDEQVQRLDDLPAPVGDRY